MSHNVTTDSGNLFASPLNDFRSERAPANINYCELSSRFLVPIMHARRRARVHTHTHTHTHTHFCIPVVHEQCWVQFSQITPVQWINLELCLDGFPKLLPPLALCSHVLDLLG